MDPNIDTRLIHVEDSYNKAVEMWLKGDELYSKYGNNAYARQNKLRRDSLEELGKGLHPLQDYFAHMDWGSDDYINPLSLDRIHPAEYDDVNYDYDPKVGKFVPGTNRFDATITATRMYLFGFLNEVNYNYCERN